MHLHCELIKFKKGYKFGFWVDIIQISFLSEIMWFEELSDDEFDADIVNKYTTPTYHAHTQREARRNLSKAVIFSHEWKIFVINFKCFLDQYHFTKR